MQTALANADQTAEAVVVLEGMCCKGVSPSAATCAILMRACARCGAADHAQMVIKIMTKVRGF